MRSYEKLKCDAGLHLRHEGGGVAQLLRLVVGERLADDVADAGAAQHTRQRQEHLVLDPVLALHTQQVQRFAPTLTTTPARF